MLVPRKFRVTVHMARLLVSCSVTTANDERTVEQLALFDVEVFRRYRPRWRLARRARAHARGRLLLAGGIIRDEEGRILLLHRATPSLRQWETPGGKIDGSERPEEAALRELREELGIDARVVSDLGAHDIVSGGTPITYALFEVAIANGTPSLVERDTFDELRFFAWNELVALERELSANARNLLAMHWRGRLKAVPAPNATDAEAS